MTQYQQLLHRVLTHGERVEDRTGVGTLAVFGGCISYDLRERFPVEQAKSTNWRTAFLEMLFFLSGQTNVRWLNERGSKLWDAWADANGDLGPVYGANWRRWPSTQGDDVDQVDQVIWAAKNNPGNRRLIVEGWNVGQLNEMALPPCHKSHQLSCISPGYVDMLVYQRSWDLGLGCPFNIAQYALLLHLYGRAIGRQPRNLTFAFGDAHIYWNHIDKLVEVAERRVSQDNARLVIDTENTDIDGYDISHFSVVGYEPHPAVKLEVAV